MTISKQKTHVRSLIKLALEEDAVNDDITTQILIPPRLQAKASITAKEELVIAGLDVAKHVFAQVDPSLKFKAAQKDGNVMKAGTICCTISGNARSLLKAERVALNFLQHLSGIATLTRQFCLAVKTSSTKILDTRKTTPGLRFLQKQAVLFGGGHNHRQSLKDGILIKDNHLALLKSQKITLDQACHLAKTQAPSRLKVCVETETLAQVKAAIGGKADIILLDNMPPHILHRAIQLIDGNALTEISGGITLKNVQRMANVGADFISIGALTHSARSMDLSLSLAPISQSHPRRNRNG
ncbi:MAG: nicotinate-nucleotide diphosphorylase (carboxylating) [Nitrospirales bacterium]|nr:MAG: nicotinate-nucleotide diphosphorylase (carboxylating) [Nitrospirales bacterium]